MFFRIFIYLQMHWAFVTLQAFLSSAVCGLVTAVAPPVAEHRLEGAEASVAVACHL